MSGKISGIYVEIRGDSSQLKKDLTAARQVVTEQATGMSNALNNALSPAQLKNSVNGLVKNLNTLSNASKLTGREFAAISVDLKQFTSLTGLTEKEFSRLQSRMMQTSAAKAQENALRSVAKAAGLSAKEIEHLGKQMGVSAAGIAAVNGSAGSASNSLAMLGKAGAAAIAYLSVDALLSFGRAVLDAGVAMDSLQRSFVAISGSQGGAAATLGFLRDEADRLGQSFYELAPQFKNISAAARGTALEGAGIQNVFSSIVEASTALGMSSADTEGSLRALGQMISKGTVQAEELRGQLGERLPGAFQIAARAMGVSTAELGKMLERGEVLATDLLPRLANELHKMYGVAAETSALESAQASINRLGQAWQDLKVNLFDSGTAVAGINSIAIALKGLDAVVTSMGWLFGGESVSDKWSLKDKLQIAKDNLKGLEQIEGTAFDTLPFFANSLSKARQEVNLLQAQMDGLAMSDSWLTFDKNMAAIASSQATVSAAADKKLAELSDTKLQKLAKEYESLKGKVTDEAALEKWYSAEVAEIREQETKKQESELKKQTAEHEKAIKERNELYAKQASNVKDIEIEKLKGMEKANERAIEIVNDRLEAEDKAEETARKKMQEAREKYNEDQAKEAQKTLDRITEGTADIFYEMFQDIGNGWETLWNGMKNWALRTIAELAAKAATAQIIVPILTTFTGAGTAQAAVSSLSGGTGGTSLLGNLPIGSLLDKIPGLSAVSGILGTSLPGTSTAALSVGMGENVAATLSSGLSLGSALSLGGLGGLGYSLLGGALGLPQNKYSGITASLGGALGAWGGSALGATLGATAGSILPGIGTAIGAVVGGLASKLFGGEKQSSPKVGYGNTTASWADLATNITSYTGHGAKGKNAVVFDDALKSVITTAQGQVEASLGALGAQYVDQLSATVVNWGRKSEGATWGWEFKLDKGEKDIQKQLEKASAELQAKIFAAAAPIMSQAGADYLGSDSVTGAYALLAKGAEQFKELTDIIAAGVKDGDLATYATQLQAFQAAIKTVSETWQSISQASAELVTPLTAEEQARRAINAQYDAWIAQLDALGIAQEKLSQIEADRTTLLTRVTDEAAAAARKLQDSISLTIRSAQADLSGNSGQFKIGEIASRYGWGSQYIEGGVVNKGAVQKDAIDWFKAASVAQIQAAATSRNISVEQLIEDIKFLDEFLNTPVAAVADSFQSVAETVRETSNNFGELAKSLMEYRASLLSGDASGASSALRLSAAKAEMERLSALAYGGDEDAARNLQGAADTYLGLAKTNASSATDYARSVGDVMDVLNMVAGSLWAKAGLTSADLGFAGSYFSGLSGGGTDAEIRALRGDLQAQNAAIAKNTADTARLLRRWEGDGMPETRVV
jgi:tape measure domain-containing protein